MKNLTAIIFTLLICLPIFGQTADVEKPKNSAKQKKPSAVKKLDAVLEKTVKSNEPGVAVVVVKNGEIKYRRTRGVADLTAKTSITAKTPFYIASLSKQFTAVAIMMLAEQEN